MLHATPAPLPRNAAGIVRLLRAQNTSGRATWKVMVKKDGSTYRLDYAWRGSGEVSIHVVVGKRELWAATHTVYRIRVAGRENVPESGGALFVCNHMSFVDGLLLIASIDRPIRFILYKAIYDLP